MKIIEAMKTVKLNEEKITDLQAKIGQHSAITSLETPAYENQLEVVRGWLQSCADLTRRNVELLVAIQRTNLATSVTIELGGKQVTKSIAEWVWRRRKYASIDQQTFAKLTDRNIREGLSQMPNGGTIEVKTVRFYDPAKRDEMISVFREEPHRIDAALEIVNATTDLIEG